MFTAGFAIGIAMVMPVGPVALTLVGVGVEQGRRGAVRAAAGVAAADAILVLVTGLVVTTIGLVDLPWVDVASRVLGALLVVVGVRIGWQADRTLETVSSIRRPATTMLAMTLLNPMSLALWLAVVAALPIEVLQPSSMASFGIGVAGASVLWHVGLGLVAAWVGQRLTPKIRRAGTVAGAIVIVAIGVALMV